MPTFGSCLYVLTINFLAYSGLGVWQTIAAIAFVVL